MCFHTFTKLSFKDLLSTQLKTHTVKLTAQRYIKRWYFCQSALQLMISHTFWLVLFFYVNKVKKSIFGRLVNEDNAHTNCCVQHGFQIYTQWIILLQVTLRCCWRQEWVQNRLYSTTCCPQSCACLAWCWEFSWGSLKLPLHGCLLQLQACSYI